MKKLAILVVKLLLVSGILSDTELMDLAAEASTSNEYKRLSLKGRVFVNQEQSLTGILNFLGKKNIPLLVFSHFFSFVQSVATSSLEKVTPIMNANYFDTRETLTDRQIIQSHGGDISTSLEAIGLVIWLINKQLNGKNGPLHNDGRITLFYANDVNCVKTIIVQYTHGKWTVMENLCDVNGLWDVGTRVFWKK